MNLQQASFGYTVDLPTNMVLSGVSELWLVVKTASSSAGDTGTVWKRQLDVAADVDVPNGIVRWQVLDGDLPTAGTYQLQLVDRSGGIFDASQPVSFHVGRNLARPTDW